MKKLKNLICGLFMRVRNVKVKNVPISDIETEVKQLISESLTEAEFIKRMNAIMQHYKFNKFDVYDFKATVDKLSKSIPQEKLVYASILTTSADLGVSKDDIIQSIYYYCGMFQDFLDKTKSHIDTLTSSSEEDTKDQIEKLKKQKEDNKAAMEKLLHNNNEIDSTISSLTNKGNKYSSDLKRVGGMVEAFIANSVKSLKSEKEKCTKHLG